MQVIAAIAGTFGVQFITGRQELVKVRKLPFPYGACMDISGVSKYIATGNIPVAISSQGRMQACNYARPGPHPCQSEPMSMHSQSLAVFKQPALNIVRAAL